MRKLLLTAAMIITAGCATSPQPPAAETTATATTTETVATATVDPEAFRKAAPTAAAPRPYKFPEVTRFTLPNGLRVLIAENHNAPLVTLRAVVRSGADHDPADHAGLAAFTADMLDEGAGKYDAIQLAEEIGALGGSLTTGADWDSSLASVDVLSKHADRGLQILGDVVMRPKLEVKEIERVRKNRLTTILQQRDQAGVVATDRFAQFVYEGTAYGRSIIGTEASLKKVTTSDLKKFYRGHYVPNNVSLIITGDITPAAARQLVEREFSKWKKGAAVPDTTVEPKPIGASRIFLVDRPQAVQSEIRVGHVGVPRSTSDYFPLLTMNSILGGIFGSRINLNLRERHGYTYGARSSFAFRRQPGPFIVSAPVRNEVTGASVREILSELRRIRSGDLTDAELNDAKSYLMGSFPNTVQTSTDLANRLSDMELYGLPEDYFDHYRERIASVTKDNVLHVANKYVNPDNLAIVIVGKAGDVQNQLAELQVPVALYDIEGRPIVK